MGGHYFTYHMDFRFFIIIHCSLRLCSLFFSPFSLCCLDPVNCCSCPQDRIYPVISTVEPIQHIFILEIAYFICIHSFHLVVFKKITSVSLLKFSVFFFLSKRILNCLLKYFYGDSFKILVR